MRYTTGVLLEGDDLARAARLAWYGVAWLERVNGGVQPEYVRLRDELAAFAAAQAREPAVIQVSGGREPANPAAVVIVAASPGMTAPAAAALIGVSAQAIRRWCRTGVLLATRTPAGWRVDANSAAALAARREGT